MKCMHKGTKVYADYSLTTNPPKTPWICSICGEKGIETKTPLPSYDEVVKRFENSVR